MPTTFHLRVWTRFLVPATEARTGLPAEPGPPGGVYARFEHARTLEDTPDGCRCIDAITFTPALPAQKLIAILTRRWWVFLHKSAARRLRADPQATGIGMLRVLVEAEPDPTPG